MKIILCGQKRFGRDTLQLCQRLGHEIAGVYAPRTPPTSSAFTARTTASPRAPRAPSARTPYRPAQT